MRFTAAIRRLSMDAEGSCCAVLFRSKDADDLEGQVSLSRATGSCLFGVGDLESHDGHAPAWHGCDNEIPPEKGLDACPEYVNRVFSDIIAIVGKKPKTVEVKAVGDDGVLEEDGEAFENVVQAIEKAVHSNENQAVLLSW